MPLSFKKTVFIRYICTQFCNIQSVNMGRNNRILWVTKHLQDTWIVWYNCFSLFFNCFINSSILNYESRNYNTVNNCRAIRISMIIWVPKYLQDRYIVRFKFLSLICIRFRNLLILIYESQNYILRPKKHFF